MYEIDQIYLNTLAPVERAEIERLYKLIVEADSEFDESAQTGLTNEIKMLTDEFKTTAPVFPGSRRG